MKLGEAKRLAQKLEEAEAQFDRAWDARRNVAFVLAVIGGLPLLVGLMEAVGIEVGGPVVVFGLIALLGGVGHGSAFLKRRYKQRLGAESPDAGVLKKCGELETLPPRIAEPLERAVEAYLSISRIADDPVWKEIRFPIRESVGQAADQMIALLDWGRRLGEAGNTVERLRAREKNADVLHLHYETQISKLEAASEAFHQAELKLAQAFVQIGAGSSLRTPAGAVAELGDTFEALSEVLSTLEEDAAVPLPVMPEGEGPAPLRLGRGL